MDNKIQVIFNDGKLQVDGRQLHRFLKVKTEYAKWFERMIEYGFEEGKDFYSVKNDEVRLEGTRQVRRILINHLLTLNMAKEICMLQRV